MLLKISPVVLGMALRSHSLSFFIAASMKLAVTGTSVTTRDEHFNETNCSFLPKL